MKHKKAMMARLEQELACLYDYAEQGRFCTSPDWSVGLELEGWFLDQHSMPKPLAPALLQGAALRPTAVGGWFEGGALRKSTQ